MTAINKEVGCIDNTKVISASKAPSRARKIVRMGDVLYSSVRPYLLNIAIVESEISPSPIASTANCCAEWIRTRVAAIPMDRVA